LGEQRGFAAFADDIDSAGGARHVATGRREANLLVTNQQDQVVYRVIPGSSMHSMPGQR